MRLQPDATTRGGPTPLPRGTRVQSVDRAMLLLRAVAEAPALECTAALLGERTGLNRATAWRILSTLELHQMVVCDRTTGLWSIGTGVVEVARAAGVDAVVRSARKVLERLSLQTGEIAALAVADGAGLTYVDEVVPAGVHTARWRGRTAPLHATSTGKALLAMADPADLPRLVGEHPERYTASTVTDLDALRLELERVRERGYAECQGEYREDSWGVSAPVLDRSRRAVAVLCVWGPNSRVTPARFEALGALTRDAAASLSWR